LDAFGPDLHDMSAWEKCFEAGLRQAVPAVDRIGGPWSGTD
jgi:NTE family protein